MAQRSIRFPDELEQAYEAMAAADDRSFSYVVLRALERSLDSEALSPWERTQAARRSERAEAMAAHQAKLNAAKAGKR